MKNTLNIRLKNGKLVPYGMCTESAEFGQYGVGLELFFDFIKMATIFFFMMAIISLPAIWNNYRGDGLSSYGKNLLFFSTSLNEDILL